MYRFYVDNNQIEGTIIRVAGSNVNHIKNVLRMKSGEKVIISNGQGKDFYCTIVSVSSDEIILNIEEVKDTNAELPCRITLFQALPKKDKMEWIIQKTVELGVYEIIPVMTNRCVVKLEDLKKRFKKVERWNSIAEAAAKQSARGILPHVDGPVTWKEALARAKELDMCLIPYELADGMEQSKIVLENVCRYQSVGIFIGPEGGFEEEEIKEAVSEGMEVISLGKRILRTETAGMTVIAYLMMRMSE